MKRTILSSVDTRSFWYSVCLSAVGCFLLIAALFMPPKGIVDASVVSAAGLVFVFSGSLVGINGSMNTKLAKIQMDVDEELEEERKERKRMRREMAENNEEETAPNNTDVVAEM